jgi:hypothetical protein
MKQLSFILLLFAFISGCKKSDNIAKVETAEPKTSAFFKIGNLVSNGLILEGNVADFNNLSTNADSYLWDFGNGNTSVQRIPTDISFVPCGGHYTISLQVKNKKGETATYSESFEILCRGKNAHSAGVIAPIHINTNQIHAQYNVHSHS